MRYLPSWTIAAVVPGADRLEVAATLQSRLYPRVTTWRVRHADVTPTELPARGPAPREGFDRRGGRSAGARIIHPRVVFRELGLRFLGWRPTQARPREGRDARRGRR